MRLNNRSVHAMTLVELLVVVSLLGVIIGAVMSTLGGGLRVWQRFQDQQDHSQWVVLAAYQMRSDFKNARRFGLIPFEGSYKSVAFPSLVFTRLRNSDDTVEELGRIRYYYDPMGDRLCRAETPFRSLKREKKSECTSVIEDVDRVSFSFLQEATEVQKRRWVKKWENVELPLAVRCEVQRKNRKKEDSFRHEITFDLPLGSGMIEEDADAQKG